MTRNDDYGVDRCALGLQLREARLTARLSQAALARDLDLTVAYVSKIERGNVNASRCVVLAWGLITGVDGAALIEGSKNACTSSAPDSAA